MNEVKEGDNYIIELVGVTNKALFLITRWLKKAGLLLDFDFKVTRI